MSSADAMAAQAKVQKSMTDMVDELDRTRLRKIQLQMYKCSMGCCEDQNASMNSTQRCIESCSSGVQRAQQYVQEEIGNFQNRIQRCVLDCQDTAKSNLGPNPTDAEVESAKIAFEACAIKCVDNHVPQMPDLLRRMQKYLESITKY